MERSTTALALGLCILVLSSCGTLEIESLWSDSAITVDGRLDDWGDRLHDVKDANLSFGVENDDRFLYLSLRSADPRVQEQIVRSGLVVWFDPRGGNDRFLGVHYPIGRDWREFPGLPEKDEEGRRKRREDVRERLEEAEVIGPGRDEKKRFKVEEIPGIALASLRSAGFTILEMRVPLERTEETPYALGLETGRIVGIRLDTPNLDFLVPGRGLGGPGMGNFGPLGYGRGYPGGGGILIGRGLRGTQPLKIRLKALLAEPPER